MTDVTTYCDVNTCEDCPRYGDDCDGDKRVERTDLISRADAIDAVCRTRCGDKAKGCPAHSCLVIEEFESLPSAEAEFADLPDIPRYYYEKVVGNMAHEINMLKEQLESADAVEVVRCKDCIHKYVSGNGTTQYYVCDFMDAQYEDDGFCHHGESEVEE